MRSDFDDVGDFHRKFGLANVPATPRNAAEAWKQSGDRILGKVEDAVPRFIDAGLLEFRLKFLREELDELHQAVATNDLAGMADALVDLVYVAMGTAHLHGFPWSALWDEVQRANMAKERCELDHKFVPANKGEVWSKETEGMCHRINADQTGVCGRPQHKHSLRGNINDVIKPPGWTKPDIERILVEHGWDPRR